LRVLVSAYACEPGKGSEPGVGWNWVRQIARFHEVWVITRANNREPIERALAKEPLPNVHWVYFDLPRWARFWKRGARGVHLYYYCWQLGACLVARRLQRSVAFDLAHHVTFVNYWTPTFLSLLAIPFIWGPVGGGESAPRSFQRAFSMRGRLYEMLRDYARKMGECDPLVRLTARRAATALATTDQTQERLRALGCRRVSVLSQAGLPAEDIRELMELPLHLNAPFRVLSLGRLLHWKGCELGLRAFAEFQRRHRNSEYGLVGDGPERKRLEQLARELGVKDNVFFWGTLPRDIVFTRLAECDLLLFPSLHDSGGWVSLEAMAAGRPVVCLDLGGPASQVTEETGIKVPAISPEQVVKDLAGALATLAGDPKLCRRMSLAARERVRNYYNWQYIGNQMEQFYKQNQCLG
jgi:glycosyltransferase involved in cell wall biosynthesis